MKNLYVNTVYISWFRLLNSLFCFQFWQDTDTGIEAKVLLRFTVYFILQYLYFTVFKVELHFPFLPNKSENYYAIKCYQILENRGKSVHNDTLFQCLA